MKASALIAAFGALVARSMPSQGAAVLDQFMPRVPRMPSRRTLPRDEAVLRASGRWSPAMEKPHSQRKWHIRIPEPKPQHFWRVADTGLPTAEFPPGTVIELVNGWGQVVQRTWI